MRYLKITTLLLLTIVTSISAQTQKINLSIEKELIINTNIAKSWQVLGPEFTEADNWAATVYTSEGKGEIIKGIHSGRICITPMGTLNEKVIEYSVEKHLLSYQFEGMPKMVRYARNTWQLASLGENKTELTLHMEMKIGGLIGILMKPMLRMKMAKMAKHTIEEFKYYVEKGKQHPRKVKSVHKFNKRNLKK